MPEILRKNGLVVIPLSTGSTAVFGIAVLVMGLGIEAAMIAQSSAHGSTPVELLPLLAPLAFCLVGLGLLLSKFSRFEADDEGLSQFNMLNRQVFQMAWSEVTAYELGEPKYRWSTRKPLVIVASGTPHRIKRFGFGWPLVDHEILKHLPRFKSPIGAPAGEMQRRKPEIPPEGLTFRPGSFLFAGILVMAMGAFFMVASVAIPPRPGPERGAGPIFFMVFGFVVIAIGAVLAMYAVKAKIILTETDLTTLDINGRPKDTMRWKDVEVFAYETFVSSRNGTTYYFILIGPESYMRLSSQISRWPVLKVDIVGMLPPTARVT